MDSPGGPGVKNLPCNPGDTGSIPAQGTKIPYANRVTKPEGHIYWACMPQLESLHDRVKDPTWCNKDPVRCDWDLMQPN